MAEPTDCFDECTMEATEDGLLAVRLAPGGGLEKKMVEGECVGLGVVTADQISPTLHIGVDGVDLVMPSPLNGGIVLAPGSPSAPLTGLVSGLPVTNGFDRPAILTIRAVFDGIMLQPPAASNVRMYVSSTVDGVTFKRGHTTGYYGDGGGDSRAGTRNFSQAARYTMSANGSPGDTLTPQFMVFYESVSGDGAEFVQASIIHYDVDLHTV